MIHLHLVAGTMHQNDNDLFNWKSNSFNVATKVNDENNTILSIRLNQFDEDYNSNRSIVEYWFK